MTVADQKCQPENDISTSDSVIDTLFRISKSCIESKQSSLKIHILADKICFVHVVAIDFSIHITL
jgi:hypothetical protein